MRCLLAVALVGLAAAGSNAADKPEDLAKQVALDMLKAVKAKNLDDAMKLVGTPYFFQMGDKPELLEKADAVREKLKVAFDRPIKDADLPTEVTEVLTMAKAKEKFGGKGKPETLEMIEKAAGKDGFVVVLGKDGMTRGGFLVAMKDGKAKVVGIPR